MGWKAALDSQRSLEGKKKRNDGLKGDNYGDCVTVLVKMELRPRPH